MMNKREEITQTLTSCLKQQKVFQFHNLYEESEKFSEKNVEQISGEKDANNKDNNKEKRMKIKINFKPYIPKTKKGNRRKQDQSEFKFNKKQFLPVKDDAKAFIKVVDISLLTEPRKDASDKDIVCCDIEENVSHGVQDTWIRSQQQETIQALDYSINVANLNNWPNNDNNEPLDLSRKPKTHHNHQLRIGEPSPLDLSKTREDPQLVRVGEPPPLIPIKRNGQTFVQLTPADSDRGNNHQQYPSLNPVEPPVNQTQTVILGSKSTSPPVLPVITLHPIQLVYTRSQFIQPGTSQDKGLTVIASHSTTESSKPDIIFENVNKKNFGKISKRKTRKPGIHPQNSSENQGKFIEISLNEQEIIHSNLIQNSLCKQIQEVVDDKLLNWESNPASPNPLKFTECQVSPTIKSLNICPLQQPSTTNKQTWDKNACNLKNKLQKEIPSKSQTSNKTGMIKINEKVTSNGGVFCTFRNFTGRGTSTFKTKAKDIKKKRGAK